MRQQIVLIGSCFVLPLFLMQCGNRKVPAIRIYGSTTIEPFMRKAVNEFSKIHGSEFSLQAVGSKDGIDSLITGAGDIAMSSMEILPEQIEKARRAGVSLKPFLLGYDVIVPVVHLSNSISDISLDQLRDIFEGRTANWAALGGPDTGIDVVDRSDASGTFTIWHHYIVPFSGSEQPAITDERLTVQPSNSSVLAYVHEHANAIGYVSSVYLNPEVKALRLNGIAIAENDSLLSEYHLKRPLYLYVDENRFDGPVKTFLIFLIINEQGRALLRQAGFFSSFTLAPLYNAVEKMSER